MSNIGSNISAGVTVTLGIFNMDNNQFSPFMFLFYLAPIILLAFIVSFGWELLQDRFIEWMNHKIKGKKHDMGLGNRYF